VRCGLPLADEVGLATVETSSSRGRPFGHDGAATSAGGLDELKLVLEMRSVEWASYLEVQTGETRVSRIDRFGGEREEHELTDKEVEAGLADGTLIAVDFADAVLDARARRGLQQALGGSQPSRRFKDALAAHPRERAQWFAFRGYRLRDAVRGWLANNSIEPTTEPPARCGQAAPRGAP
jgi:hypothetical protein